MKKNQVMAWPLRKIKIVNQDKHSYTVNIKYIRSLQPFRKRNYDTKHRCSHFNQFEDNSTPHDHFFQYNKSTA